MTNYNEFYFEVRDNEGNLQATFQRKWEAQKYASGRDFTITKITNPVTYYHIIRDGKLEGRASTKEQALMMISSLKEIDVKHFMLKPKYAIMTAPTEEYV